MSEDLNKGLDAEIRQSTPSNGGGGDGQLPYAIATLVLGIISILGCFTYGVIGLICGIIALSLHSKDKKTYATNKEYYSSSYKLANAGYICAIIGTALSAVMFLFLILYILFAVSVISSMPY